MDGKRMSLDRRRKRELPARLAVTAFLVAGILSLSLVLASCGVGPGHSGAPAGDQSASEATPSFHNRFSFLVCGDPHGRTDLLTKIVAQAREEEFLVVVGDITTGKGVEEMRAMRDFLDQSGVLYHVIPGDNDMPEGSRAAFWKVFGADYYSLDVQDTHLVFLNNAVVGVGCPPREISWLREDLSGAGGKLVIAFAHVPPGAPVEIEERGFTARELESNREMKELLATAGAPVIYCGHIHAYMLYSSGPPRVVVTGGAGARPHLSPESGGFHHFLRVTVEDGQVREEVIPL
ncbi:MAG: metallophosphoesterase family protein [Actinomycetota bacterium]